MTSRTTTTAAPPVLTAARSRLGSKQALIILAIGLVLAAGLRIGLSGGGGNAWDLEVYKSWAKIIAERGVVHAYDGDVIVDYPPVFLYWLEAGVRGYQAVISPDLDTSRIEFTYLVRLPGIVLDLVLAVMIYAFVRRRGGESWALAASLGYAFNPGVIFDLAYWGMPDSPHAVLIMAAIWLALKRQWLLAWAVISVGVFTKPQADIFAPVVALITLRDGGWRACLRGIAGIVLGVLVAIGPFLVAGTAGGVLDQFLRMADYDPFISNNAHNLWWLVGWGYGWQIHDTELFLGPITYRTAAIALLAGFYAFSLFRLWRTRDETLTIEIAAYAGLQLFMLMTVVHENHSYAVLPLLALIWWRDRRLMFLYLALSAVFLINLVLHDSTIYEQLQAWHLHYRHISATLVNAVFYMALFIWWTLRVGGARFRQPFWPPLAFGTTALAAVLVFTTSPQLVSASYDPATIGVISNAEFGAQIRLLGYEFSTERAEPGQTVSFSFVWQAIKDLDEHYMLFVHLLNMDNQNGGIKDGPPTRNLYPTRYWRAGEVIRDQRTVTIPANAAPGVYRVEIGFYPLTNYQRLEVITADGTKDNRLVIGRVTVVGPPAAAPQVALNADLGEAITLAGYTPANAVGGQKGELVPASGLLPLTLVWQSRAATQTDYTVFLQLLDSRGTLVAQYDAQPQHGNYPTSAWQPGDTIADPVTLKVPALPPGEYRLIAGMYDLATGKRLPAATGDSIPIATVREGG